MTIQAGREVRGAAGHSIGRASENEDFEYRTDADRNRAVSYEKKSIQIIWA